MRLSLRVGGRIRDENDAVSDKNFTTITYKHIYNTENEMKRLTRGFAWGVALGVTTICSSGTTNAQEGEESGVTGEAVEMTVIAGDETGGAPMIFATRSRVGGDGGAEDIQIMSGSFSGGPAFISSSGGMLGGSAPNPWSMLSNPSVQKDLELVGDQLKQVEDLQAEFARQMKEQIGDLTKGGFSADRFEGIGELVKKLQKEQHAKMEGLLLPHQIKRLKQVALQTHMKNAGAAGALVSAALAEELGITEEQQERLKERSKEIEKKLAEDTAKLKEKAKEELLKELTSKQRSLLKEMTGDKYEPQSKDWKESMMKRFGNKDAKKKSTGRTRRTRKK